MISFEICKYYRTNKKDEIFVCLKIIVYLCIAECMVCKWQQ